jgi:hypothetical protein
LHLLTEVPKQAMTNDTRRDLLKAEYLHLQNVVVSYDGQLLTIKAWSVTASLAGLAAAFSTHSVWLLVLSLISSVLFWITEALWKAFQHAYYGRINELESDFTLDEQTLAPMQTWKRWNEDFPAKVSFKETCERLKWLHVLLPHGFVAGVSLLLLILVAAGRLHL